MNTTLARLTFALSRAYTSRFRRARGTSRLLRFVERSVVPSLPNDLRVRVNCDDGRTFDVSVHDPNAFYLFMENEYDPRESALLRRLVRPGDTAFDIGANDGWYTTLLAQLVGRSGQVHAFEPTPPTHRLLRETCDRNGLTGQITFNTIALGAEPGKATIYVPPHRGGASLKAGAEDAAASFECEIATLDDYCERTGVGEIRLIKCDVEGSEFSILRGAAKLLASHQPPMWLLELNRQTSAAFGYEPFDLLRHLAGFGYGFYRLAWHPLGRLSPFRDGDHFLEGENVLCAIARVHGDVEQASAGNGERATRTAENRTTTPMRTDNR